MVLTVQSSCTRFEIMEAKQMTWLRAALPKGLANAQKCSSVCAQPANTIINYHRDIMGLLALTRQNITLKHTKVSLPFTKGSAV